MDSVNYNNNEVRLCNKVEQKNKKKQNLDT